MARIVSEAQRLASRANGRLGERPLSPEETHLCAFAEAKLQGTQALDELRRARMYPLDARATDPGAAVCTPLGHSLKRGSDQ